jgi:2-phospho-L-lactate guanylyltransferase (CobY/MobA/RfbA family)
MAKAPLQPAAPVGIAGIGVVRSDLPAVNKVDVARFIGVDGDRSVCDSRYPVLTTNCRSGGGVEVVIRHRAREIPFRP